MAAVGVVAALAALGIAFGWLVGSSAGGRGDEEPGSVVLGGTLIAAYFTAEGRVASSPVIVLADFRDESEDTLQVSGSAGEPITRTDTVRTFSVAESLRGDLRSGDEIRVRWTTQLVFPELEGSAVRPERHQTAPAVTEGERYVLFLSAADVPGEWFASGEPSIASLAGDSLSFAITGELQEIILEDGVPADSEGVPLALAGLTLDDLRLLASVPFQLPGEGSEPSDPGLDAAFAVDQLISELPAMKTAAEIEARAVGLGYDIAAREADPAFCRKAETAVSDLSGIAVSFDCP